MALTLKRLKPRIATSQTMYAKICLHQKLAKEIAMRLMAIKKMADGLALGMINN
jgi:hypothetical protein